jgi:hypothetical protein
MVRREAADLAASAGCEVAASVTRSTTILVVGDQDVRRLAGQQKSSKQRKVELLIASGLQVRVVSETDFLAMVDVQNGKSDSACATETSNYSQEIRANRVDRSTTEPLRGFASTDMLWSGPDRGLIWCWERGRQKAAENPSLAERARRGELVPLAWKGGVDTKLEGERKSGTLQYLATWQGLRGDDLRISFDGVEVVTCSRTGQSVVFSSEAVVEVR